MGVFPVQFLHNTGPDGKTGERGNEKLDFLTGEEGRDSLGPRLTFM